MKNTVLFIILFVISQFVFSQESDVYEVTFEDGSVKKFQYVYDNPNAQPKMLVDLDFFKPIIFGGEIIMAYKIRPEYKLNDKSRVDLSLTRVYATAIDGSIHDSRRDEISAKPYLNFDVMYHYNVFSNTSEKMRKTTISYMYPRFLTSKI